jgi:tryptophan-rich sensory protein
MRWISLLSWIAACHLAGALGALTTDASLYHALPTPEWAPPAWLFAPVWLTLYTAMGIAAWRVWTRPRSTARTRALGLFAVQLALNAAWSPVFFGLEAPRAALLVIALLWLAIASTIAAFGRVSRGAALLLVPYLAWVTFATALNAAIVWLLP